MTASPRGVWLWLWSWLGLAAAVAPVYADPWSERLLTIRREQERQINLALDALILRLPPEQRQKVEGKVRARLGWAYPRAVVDCSVGNTALLRMLPDRYEIWICEEGLRAVTDAAAGAALLQTDDRRTTLPRVRRLAEYFFKRYLYEVTTSAQGRGWAAVSCLPYQVAYLAATTDQDPIQCDRSRPHSADDPDAQWAARAAVGAVRRLVGRMPAELRPPEEALRDVPIDFNAQTGLLRDFLIEYLLLHELAHIVVPAAQISDFHGCRGPSVAAEIAADAFALSPAFGGMKMKPLMMGWQSLSWSFLQHAGALSPATQCQLARRDAGLRQSFCARDRQLTDPDSRAAADAWLEDVRQGICAD